ncbi:MAG: DUF5719 family protein [Propionicimonas sp.]|nr:DUF5719 family protein [Propionicimonas sp.]
MNRFVVPVVTLTAVAAAVAASLTVWPVAQPPSEPAPPDTSRVSVLCPSFDSATASVRVAVADTGEGVRTAPLSTPDQQDEPGQVAVLAGRSEPVLVSGQRSATFGATSVARAESGPDRGLSAATCEGAVTQRWFAGVELGEDAQADLLLANTDSTDASVDVTIYGPDGPINSPGSRGVVVEAHSSRSVPLSVLATATGPVSLLVESSQGRTAATLRQRLWDGTEPRGSDWVPAAAAPATDLVIPGIAAGAGDRELVVTNPGERTAIVAVEVLGEAGRSALAGVENLEVPAGATRGFDLGAGLAGQVAGLHLTSAQEVLAAVRQSSTTSAAGRDPAWAAALDPVGPDGLWPVPASTSATSVLLLSNPGQQDVVATVTLGNQLGGPGETSQETVPAGSTLQVPIPKAEVAVVRVQAAAAVHGAIVVTGRLGQVRGLAVLPLVAATSAATQVPPVRFDPHAGS